MNFFVPHHFLQATWDSGVKHVLMQVFPVANCITLVDLDVAL